MTNWIQKIELNQVLAQMSEKHDLSFVEKPCPDEVKEAIASEIAKADCLAIYAGRIRRAGSIAAVNRALETVFDVADRNLIWCGLFCNES